MRNLQAHQSTASVGTTNDPVHRAAANNFPFQNRAARGSVCNGWFGATCLEPPPLMKTQPILSRRASTSTKDRRNSSIDGANGRSARRTASAVLSASHSWSAK